MSARVAIGLSGGVDSSVAAALLRQQGYAVIGLMLRLWSEADQADCALNRCCSPEAMTQARRVADLLDIPFYVLDAQAIFKTQVVDYFVAAYAAGETPNPCLACNRALRWDFLLNKALAFEATALATGHYARVRPTPAGYELLKGVDERKDQSYVLSVMTQAQLSRARFPLGEYTKPQVRELARSFKLPVAERPESQDICFLADGDYQRFLREQRPDLARPGPIVRRAGRQIGQHSGLPFYTVGQRKGLGLGGPEPLYVLELRPATNTLVVGAADELGGDRLQATQVNWIQGAPPAAPWRAQVKIRYKAPPAWATLRPLPDGALDVVFEQPVRGITPGQSAVFYLGEVCLGGGVIRPPSSGAD